MKALERRLVQALVAVSALAPLVVFFALPVFDGGLYRQVETVALVLHFLSAAASMLLLLLMVASPSKAMAPFRDTAIIAVLAVAAAGLLASPFASDWGRTFHGTLEHGVGILWHAETAVLAGAALVAWRMAPRARPFLACSSAGSVVGCAALQVAGLKFAGGGLFLVYDFPEYLGINAMIAAVPLLALGRRWADGAAAILVVASILLSGNRAIAVAVVFALAVAYAGHRKPAAVARYAPVVSLLAVLGAALALPFLAPVLEMAATRGVDPTSVASPVPSEARIDHVAVQLKPYGTIWLRSVTARLVAERLLSVPSEFLVGEGFGSFDTVAESERRSAPGRLMVAETATSSLSYWDGGQKSKFHSHNMVWESLLSAGFLAAAAWLAFVYCCARRIDVRRPMAGSLLLGVVVVGASLWFFVNAAAPLVAVAIASTSGRGGDEEGPVEPAPSQVTSSIATILLAFGMLAFFMSGVIMTVAVRTERLERAFVAIDATPSGAPPCQGYEAISLPNPDINRKLYEILVRRIVDRGDGAAAEMEPRLVNVANYSCLMRKAGGGGDVLSLLASLRARSTLVGVVKEGVPLAVKPLRPDFALWADDLDLLLALAPGRTDLVIPYVRWLDPLVHKAEVVAAVDRFLPRVREGDPVRDWLVAAKAQAAGDRTLFVHAFAKSLREGVANLYLVSPELAAGVRAADAVR